MKLTPVTWVIISSSDVINSDFGTNLALGNQLLFESKGLMSMIHEGVYFDNIVPWSCVWGQSCNCTLQPPSICRARIIFIASFILKHLWFFNILNKGSLRWCIWLWVPVCGYQLQVRSFPYLHTMSVSAAYHAYASYSISLQTSVNVQHCVTGDNFNHFILLL